MKKVWKSVGLGRFFSFYFFKIPKIWLEIRDLLAHIEGAYQVRG